MASPMMIWAWNFAAMGVGAWLVWQGHAFMGLLCWCLIHTPPKKNSEEDHG